MRRRALRFVWVAVLVAVFSCIGLWRVSKSTTFQFFGELHARVETPEKAVALTFDDGPNPRNTPALLDLLKRERVHATFFLVGKNLQQNSELAQRELSEGHQLANHSYSHTRMILSSREFCRDEVTRTDELIRRAGFRDAIVFRPPFGKKLFTLPWVLSELGKPAITWDAASEDTETQDTARLVRNVMSRVRSGSIILFHDGGAAKPGTLAAVREVVGALEARGFRFVTVNELLGLAGR